MDTVGSSTKSFPTLRVVLVLLVLVAVAAYARFALMQHTGTQQAEGRNDMLDVRLQNLENNVLLQEKRIGKLEEDGQKKPAVPVTAPTASASATPPSADEEKRIAALEKQLAAQPVQQNQTQIYEAIRLLSAFHHFSAKVLSGKPYAAELAAFEQQMNSDDEDTLKLYSALTPFAESGVPTFAQLLASFDDSVSQLNTAEGTPPPDAGLWGRFIYTLTHLISVRKIDDSQAGTSPDAIVARAEAHLEREEIEPAATEIKSLPAEARGNFNSWLEDAQAFTTTPVIVDQIEEQVMLKAFHAKAPKTASSAETEK